jgi:hypothetical protein
VLGVNGLTTFFGSIDMNRTLFQLNLMAAVAAATLLAACGGGGGDSPDAGGGPGPLAVDPPQGRAQALVLTLPPMADAPAGLAGNVSCANLHIGAATVDNVTVPAGTACRLTGTRVLGSVAVETGAVLLAGGGVNVTGNVQGQGAAHVQVTGSTSRIGGSLDLEGGGSAALEDAQVLGNVQVNGLADVFTLERATVSGGVQVTDNRGGGTIASLRVTGNLQCFGNVPAPIAENNSAAALEGQCAPGAGSGGGTGGGGSGGGSTPPLSGNVTCSGLTLGALNLDSVIVPAGATCTLMGTRMIGSVEVGANAKLIADAVSINGNLIADGAAELRITGASSAGGSVQIQRGTLADVSGMRITGNLQLDAMTGPATLAGNRVTGNLQAVGNRGGVALIDNTMGGTMQCKENLPAPTGSGNVATLKEDQCLGL